MLGAVSLLPCWNLVVPFNLDDVSHENRALAKPPVFHPGSPDSLPLTLEPWFQDHFPFRNLLLNTRMAVDIHLLKQTPIPDYVIMGSEQWLYNTGDELAVYRGVNRFSGQELYTWIDEWEHRKVAIDALHAKMLVAIIPDKYSIYPEYLPINLKRVNTESRTDQVVRKMQEAGLEVLDIRKILLKMKNDSLPLFYKGDTHWNLNAGFFTYQEVMKGILRYYPKLGPVLSKSDYYVTKTKQESGNLSRMLYLKNGCGDYQYHYKRKGPLVAVIDTCEKYRPPKGFSLTEAYEERFRCQGAGNKKLLVIRDSFGHYILHFLKENFSETVSIFDAWEYKLNQNIIEREKPDVVLYLILESNLDAILRCKGSN